MIASAQALGRGLLRGLRSRWIWQVKVLTPERLPSSRDFSYISRMNAIVRWLATPQSAGMFWCMLCARMLSSFAFAAAKPAR
tara:strand:- start:223 stop:468 length:246 start_codon:yes stop_codon:yes gene_type:complete